MVWSGNGYAQKGENGCHEALSLTQRQMKREPQHKGGLDRHIRIMGLAAWVQARRRLPFGDRLVRHPQRQAAAVPKAGVVRRPISDSEFHLPEMLPAIRVVFVRHQKETQSVSSTDQPSIASPAQTPDIAASMQQRHEEGSPRQTGALGKPDAQGVD